MKVIFIILATIQLTTQLNNGVFSADWANLYEHMPESETAKRPYLSKDDPDGSSNEFHGFQKAIQKAEDRRQIFKDMKESFQLLNDDEEDESEFAQIFRKYNEKLVKRRRRKELALLKNWPRDSDENLPLTNI
uniref:Uncharacterized protein n=1 Tax=Rhabditophanes sp. KR3021 TaxID=114890 RepID=A0AC35TQP0_9BILA